MRFIHVYALYDVTDNMFLTLSVSVFENSICRKSGTLDPERTQDMAAEEQILVDELENLRTLLTSRYFWEHLGDDDEDTGWVPAYTEQVEKQLREDADLGSVIAGKYKDGRASTQEVHCIRRRIAILHEEIDLWRQGIDIPQLAIEQKVSVAMGYGYVYLLNTYITCIEANALLSELTRPSSVVSMGFSI